MSLNVAYFPDVNQLAANPYWSNLRSALESLGVVFTPPQSRGFGRRWLWENRHQIDVLHFHYIQQFYAYEHSHARLTWVLRFARNLFLARLWGYRTVFTLHNLTPTYPLRPAWVDYLGHWAAANGTEHVIVHCEVARQELANRYGRRNHVHVIKHPNFIGVYPNQIGRDEARARLGYVDGTIFLFLGGIRPNKGIETLIGAFRRLNEPRVRLFIAGDCGLMSDYLHQLQALAENDLRIQFHARFIPDEELQIFFNAADIVVLPFTRILTSGSVMLAMSFGRPVVVPALGCLPEQVAPGASILYDSEEPEGLYCALKKALALDLHSMGWAARKHVESVSWLNAAEQTLATYGSKK